MLSAGFLGATFVSHNEARRDYQLSDKSPFRGTEPIGTLSEIPHVVKVRINDGPFKHVIVKG